MRMALKVIVVHREASKEVFKPLASHLEECRNVYAIEVVWEKWQKAENLLRKSEGPALWILEAPRDEAGDAAAENYPRLMQALNEQAQTWTYVLSPDDRFDSDKAAEAWLGYHHVVNYDLIKDLDGAGLRQLIGRLSEWAAEDNKRDYQVGQWLQLPKGEYDQHKFVSLFLGNMRSVIVEVRRFLHTLEEEFPLRHAESNRLRHPFLDGEGGFCPPQELFDKTVENGGKHASQMKWMRELRKERQQQDRGYTLPHLLITGETGTGKTLLARFIHRYRFRNFKLSSVEERLRDLILQDLNCGAISEKLAAGELFGGLAGAWTDLKRNYPGKIFNACEGTLFLDEIGSMPLGAQATLLKFLDDNTFQPLGWHGEPFYIPAAVIAATNQPLLELVEGGEFRQDLYERFRFRVRLPNLRERLGHFEELVDFVLQNPKINGFVDKNESERKVNFVSEEALHQLRQYDWPGNFRELEQVLWEAVHAAQEEGIDALMGRHIHLPHSHHDL